MGVLLKFYLARDLNVKFMILGFEVCQTWKNYALYFLKFSLLRCWAKKNIIDMFTADSERRNLHIICVYSCPLSLF